jgi:hypothetical protein
MKMNKNTPIKEYEEAIQKIMKDYYRQCIFANVKRALAKKKLSTRINLACKAK